MATRLPDVMLLRGGPRQDPARPSPSATALVGTSLYPLARARLVCACHLKVDPTSLWPYCRQDSDSRPSEWYSG
ncbi:hypothetical protein FIBSPDRAFT_871821 [Athelia psychrophila]|uniref:Uncharacterized protein n=1 Tax=Athelia psychrophila TaxID=1759441 RepID=A0A166A2L5_9AGAM|nr:hypothetical protein FIBSPDRAFT_871821 [Fibularhizoctonia sp. CBS 109695]